MKQRCVREVSRALGRPIDGVEAQAIEASIVRALREDRKADPDWKNRSGIERVLAAGQRLGREALGEALQARGALAPRRLQQFGGERSQAIDPTELWRAQEMQAEGADEVAIWRETGWWQNPVDGKWRYEIDDSRAAFAPGTFADADGVPTLSGRLGEVLAFDELFAAYPTLGDLDIRVTLNALEPEGGALIPEGARDGVARDLVEVNARDEASALGILLHELQHAIQAIEGFAQGGSLEAARGPEYAAAFAQQVERGWAVADAELAAKGLTRETLAARHPQIHAAMQESVEEDAAWRTYLRIAGEMEARNVENRRGQGLGKQGNKKLGSRARRSTPPSETFDMALSEAVLPLEDGENLVALRSVAGNALGPKPGADAGSRNGGAARRQEGRRPPNGVGARERFAALVEEAARRDRQALGQSGDGVGPRGETTIPAGGVFAEPGVLVALFETADKSTPFHEFGHVYLETMAAYAARANAPAALRRDYAAVRKWLGAAGDGAFTTDQHEKFARGFEAYLREGRAPDAGLARFFAAFRDWLTAIYRSVRDLDVELDDEIRAVFDNLMRGVGDVGTQLDPGAAGAKLSRPGAPSLRATGAGRSPGAAAPAGYPDARSPAGPAGGGNEARAGQGGQGAGASALNPRLIARDPELKDIADELADTRAEIDALERQGRIDPIEAAAARADLEAVEKTAARPELLRAAAACLRFGARVNPGVE